jgi:hypothetical protein
MTRIGTIREVIERNGGKILTWYSDGPLWRAKASQEIVRMAGPMYKLDVDISKEGMDKILVELNMFGKLSYDVKRAYLSRKYKGKSGYLKIEFYECYCDFLTTRKQHESN